MSDVAGARPTCDTSTEVNASEGAWLKRHRIDDGRCACGVSVARRLRIDQPAEAEGGGSARYCASGLVGRVRCTRQGRRDDPAAWSGDAEALIRPPTASGAASAAPEAEGRLTRGATPPVTAGCADESPSLTS